VKNRSAPDRIAAERLRSADRAEALSAGTESGKAPLLFAAALLRAESATVRKLAEQPLTGVLERDHARLLESARDIFDLARRSGFPALLGEATLERLRAHLTGPEHDPLARAILRPYFRLLSALGLLPDPKAEAADVAISCPFCQGRPQIALRRSAPDSNGAARFVVCALCGGEWPVGRIHCPSCAEEDPAKLPIFQSETHTNVRVEACDTCRTYVKSIDLSVDARPIPVVDDLVSIAMDLWAVDRGYRRLEPGLAGI
jgi:formate dehydrogenase maturation protein FdhE